MGPIFQQCQPELFIQQLTEHLTLLGRGALKARTLQSSLFPGVLGTATPPSLAAGCGICLGCPGLPAEILLVSKAQGLCEWYLLPFQVGSVIS